MTNQTYNQSVLIKKTLTRRPGKVFAALSCIGMFAASSAWATVISWNLNPNGTEGAVGSTSQTFVSSGYSLTAYGYTVGNPNTALGLYFKNDGSDEIGLGVVATPHHELQASGGMPLQFIQLDLTSLLNQGFTDGKIEIGSVQSGESFALYGSNAMGVLGTQIGTFDSSSDLAFVDVPNFGQFDYISVGALTFDVLPVAFQATIAARVPDRSSTLLLLAIGSLGVVTLRRHFTATQV